MITQQMPNRWTAGCFWLVCVVVSYWFFEQMKYHVLKIPWIGHLFDDVIAKYLTKNIYFLKMFMELVGDKEHVF